MRFVFWDGARGKVGGLARQVRTLLLERTVEAEGA